MTRKRQRVLLLRRLVRGKSKCEAPRFAFWESKLETMQSETLRLRAAPKRLYSAKIAHELHLAGEICERCSYSFFFRRYNVAGSIPSTVAASSIVRELAITFRMCSFSISSSVTLPPTRNSDRT